MPRLVLVFLLVLFRSFSCEELSDDTRMLRKQEVKILVSSSLSNKPGSVEDAYTRALTAKLGKGEDFADMIIVSQDSLVMDDGWVQKPRNPYDLEANPSPIVMKVRVNTGLVPVVFDVDDLSAAVGLGLYAAVCDEMRVSMRECPASLREQALKRLIEVKAAAACARWLPLMTPSSSNAVEQQHNSGISCLASGTRALAASVASLVHLSDSPEEEGGEEIGEDEFVGGSQTTSRSVYRGRYLEVAEPKLPSFGAFEKERYASLCDDLTLSARHYQPRFLEGNLWLQGEEEREAFLSALALVDVSTAAAGMPLWTYTEIGFNAGHSAAMVLSVFPRAVVACFDLCHHLYAAPNHALLRARFGPSRVLPLTCGDSRDTVPAAVVAASERIGQGVEKEEQTKKEANVKRPLSAAAPTTRVSPPLPLSDVVRVDGGHEFDVAAADVLNAQRLAKPGGMLILDDCEANGVHASWEFAVGLGVVAPFLPGLSWKGSCHGHYARR
jgi:hypothetical protein